MDLASLQNELRQQNVPQLVSGWDNNDLFKLFKMYKDKCTLETMCTHFGKTRGQISGLLHRARQKGLVGQAHPKLIELPIPREPKPKPTIAPFNVEAYVKRVTAPKPAFKKPRRLRLRLITDEKQVTFKELEAHHCRFPIGDPKLPDFRFCGCTRLEGKPYCAAHNVIVGRLYDQQK